MNLKNLRRFLAAGFLFSLLAPALVRASEGQKAAGKQDRKALEDIQSAEDKMLLAEEKSKALDIKVQALAAQELELENRSAEIERQKASLMESESDLDRLEKELAKSREDLKNGQSALSGEKKAWSLERQKHADDTQSAGEGIRLRREALEKEKQALEERSRSLDAWQETLTGKQQAVSAKRAELSTQQQALDQAKNDLEIQKNGFLEIQKDLEREKESLSRERAALDVRHQKERFELESEEHEIGLRKEVVLRQAAEVDEKAKDLKTRERELAEREKALEANRVAIQKYNESYELQQKEAVLKEGPSWGPGKKREDSPASKEAGGSGDRSQKDALFILEERTKALDAKEQELAAREKELEAARAEPEAGARRFKPEEVPPDFGISNPGPAPQMPLSEENPGEGRKTLEEISDRNYYLKLRELFGLARNSIDLALSEIAFTGDAQDPVKQLVEDLIRARKRGLKVRMFLNVFSDSGYNKSLFLHEDVLQNLKDQEIEVHFINPDFRLHDRLVLIDHYWTLEGGIPWVKEELEKGLGSGTLIGSSAMADDKRIRLELIPLWDVQVKKEERIEGRLPVPLYLMTDMKYFPAMVRQDDADALKIYLALLRAFYRLNQVSFKMSLEELSQEIPAGNYFEKGAVGFQVLKTLERLQDEYGLLKIEKQEPDAVQIGLIFSSQPEITIAVPMTFFHENFAKELSATAIYAYLVILNRSQASGESPVWLGAASNVEQDFPVPQEVFRTGTDELRRQNLIEVYPFHLTGPAYRLKNSLEFRYLINPIPTLSDRLDSWSRLRDQFGDDNFKSARQLADLLGEPEDPKVVAVYIQLLKKFPVEDVQALTEHVAALPPEDSTPDLLGYLAELLEHETDARSQLATF